MLNVVFLRGAYTPHVSQKREMRRKKWKRGEQEEKRLLNVIWTSCKDFIKKEIHKDNQNELTIELTNVIVKTKSKLAIDINSVDTLYIVRGLDIQSRKGYGRLWNSDFVIHYSDAKKWKNNIN